MSTKFKDFVREVEESSTPEELEQLETFRHRFDIARQLIELRRQNEMSQNSLAEMSGVHQSEISKIERGVANPTQETWEKLVGPMGASLALVDRDGQPIDAVLEEREPVVSG